MISVALIDANRLARDGLAALLKPIADIVVVASADAGDVSSLVDANPQLVLLDLASRDGDGLRVAERLKRAIPDAKVIGLGLSALHDDLIELVDAGVAAFLPDDATLEDLARTIRSIAAGISVLPLQVPVDVLAAVHMTPREREVIRGIADGFSNKEIAARLRIATHTVKSHVRNVMAKLMLHTRLQIAAYAHRDRTL